MEIGINLMGGLGLFLYGMNLMGNGLQKSAGNKLKKIIELLTSNVIMGVLVGTLVTSIIQSSSATTVMVVGFVNAGIMTLPQAIGVIMGANIGTTMTGQIISLNLSGLAPMAIGVGMLFYLFSSDSKTKNMSEILIGFGLLFTGMEFMKDAVKPLAELKWFTDALVSFGNRPILGVLIGFGITAIIQSSSASMGMLLALASQGLIPLNAALPILYGDNIGTCVTSLLSSIGASLNAKRAATMHLLFNIIGTIIFMVVLTKPITMLVQYIDPSDISRQIANSHTLFNLINVLIQLPFYNYLVKLTLKLMPDVDSELENPQSTKFIDKRMLETPSIALQNTIKETLRMANKAKYSLSSSVEAFLEKSQNKIHATLEEEKNINFLQKTILNFLVELSKTDLSNDSREFLDSLFNTVNDIERVWDHADNISELAQIVVDNDLNLSNEAKEELNNLYSKVLSTYSYAIQGLDTLDNDLCLKVISMEQQVNNLIKICRHNHMVRLNNSICTIDTGVVFLDLITNLERVTCHSVNIAQQVIKLNITFKV
ncbi:Na/Pi cotransporter family protein [Romboutsia sp.]|uniref:Na/Pi cotransporter family protein n=1 Tax=Romboutsia sp. TaxID=1965302 RepID=UPI003F384A82